MKQTISVLVFIAAITLLGGLSCDSRGESLPVATTAPVLSGPREWTLPVFPGAVSNEKIQANMTVVAATPEALDEAACLCFGFSVHDAVFFAYRANADVQDILDFYIQQMALQGWKKVATDPSNPVLPQVVWQQGEAGPLVAYLMLAPMQEGETLIYLSVAESDSPQKIVEE